MAKLSVFWTATAVKQRNHIFEYWNERNFSNEYSKKLNRSIKERIELLKINPEIGVKTEFGNHRAISLGHYSIIYKVENQKVFITAFWDNRQKPKKLLKVLGKK